MRLLVLHNAKSGTGNRQQIVRSLLHDLAHTGFAVTPLAAGPECTSEQLIAHAREVDLVIVCGGDGTVHHALPALVTARTPMYHFPLGTENLFSREFGMSREFHILHAAIVRGDVRAMDLGIANGRLFSLMTSIGFDACVVQRVAAARTRGVSRLDYLRAGMAEFASPRVPHLTIHVDGHACVQHEHGLVVVANSRQYAARLDPAHFADMTDGKLDVVFLPHQGRLGVLRSLLDVAAGTHLEHPNAQHRSGRQIKIQCDREHRFQIDGEAAGLADSFTFEILPARLNVLMPPTLR